MSLLGGRESLLCASVWLGRRGMGGPVPAALARRDSLHASGGFVPPLSSAREAAVPHPCPPLSGLSAAPESEVGRRTCRWVDGLNHTPIYSLQVLAGAVLERGSVSS